MRTKELESARIRAVAISNAAWTDLGKEQQQELIKSLQEALPRLKELSPETPHEDLIIECAWVSGFHSCMLFIESGALVPARWQLQIDPWGKEKNAKK